ncbi:hypothetical protein Lal_00042550 [Lupinus albus]|nr:hypothetical protein Lal_00042550 [Lupinus albus]
MTQIASCAKIAPKPGLTICPDPNAPRPAWWSSMVRTVMVALCILELAAFIGEMLYVGKSTMVDSMNNWKSEIEHVMETNLQELEETIKGSSMLHL